jgi:hypothetical protein
MGEKLIISPADWAAVEQEVAKSGSIYSVPPDTPKTLWGLPVVISNEVPSGRAIVGDLGSLAHLGQVVCDCCGAVKNDAAKSPLCVCYLATNGTHPELCPDCEQCRHHHGELPFGICTKPAFVQDVIRTRARERARRKLEGAEEIVRHGS